MCGAGDTKPCCNGQRCVLAKPSDGCFYLRCGILLARQTRTREQVHKLTAVANNLSDSFVAATWSNKKPECKLMSIAQLGNSSCIRGIDIGKDHAVETALGCLREE